MGFVDLSLAADAEFGQYAIKVDTVTGGKCGHSLICISNLNFTLEPHKKPTSVASIFSFSVELFILKVYFH